MAHPIIKVSTTMRERKHIMTDTSALLADTLSIIAGISERTLLDGSLEELASRLEAAQKLQTETRAMIDALSDAIASRMEQDVANIAGLGTVQRRAKTSSTWIDESSRERMMDDAISAIIRRVAVDPATGEMHPPLANCAREVWRLAQDSFSFSADPKAAFRKVLKLAPDEYRSKRVTGYTVTITEGENNVAE
jgi:hypothetical protein